MIKFPYGISDFDKISREDYFYIDRTPYLRVLEEIGPQLLFLRPRMLRARFHLYQASLFTFQP